MSDSFAYIDIIFFAMVAAFIALRLRSVLGRKTGNEQQRTGIGSANNPSESAPANPADVPPPLPDITEEIISDMENETLRNGLVQLRKVDPSFDLPGFLEGAKAAFAMILEAYARGDRDTLKPLLSADVYDSFDSVITQRDVEGQDMQFELVSVRKADVHEVNLVDGHMARVTVRFDTDQINALKDRDGNILEGDPTHVEELTDLWTFERDTSSTDPNWTLVETRAP
ncbi:MAG: Tim44 domain-containing protein [Geminicoccaceae bacterium]|nr:Tim44 domain-containing protein [Geminicoccaceae bacterium]MCB9942144.1 Tim44 domain-containing protein [Geminicoccaceae bacterium]